eukprot:Gregarina_sp_Pseudo_9__3699@NODE_384_length_2978_cov_19_824430_g348_i1_p2_GENE_NODE_384_length_2978_cov_19_824430_g348_i1NODE_384_length_2978_cov_19_824430_g348_i1_p2_ORF_typecomplete_len207_score12_19_NODE_384_length_2978_cov_19_824430_g348_i18111431
MSPDDDVSLCLHVIKRQIPLAELSDLFAGFSQSRVVGWHVLIHLTHATHANVPIPLVFRETSVAIFDGTRMWRHSARRNRSENVLEIFGFSKCMDDDDQFTLLCPLRDDLIVKLSKGQGLALGLPLENLDVPIDNVRNILANYLANPGSDGQIFDRVLYQSQKPLSFTLHTHTAKILNSCLYWQFALPLSRPLQESVRLVEIAAQK